MNSSSDRTPGGSGRPPDYVGGKSAWSDGDLQTSVPDRFDRIAALYPEQTALILGEERWSYGMLAQAANRIANGLLEWIGMQRAPVALYLPKGFRFLAAYLGVLKSGNICLPLDPGQPVLRSRAIVEGTQAAALLTDSGLAGESAALTPNAPRFELEDLLARPDGGSPDVQLAPSDPGLLCVTSGSTGTPKAVLRDHRNMLHHALTYSSDHDIGVSDRQSFLYSVQSGASMPDLLGALLNGATLLPFDVGEGTAQTLLAWLKASQVTLLHLPIPLFRLLVDAADGKGRLPALRVVLVGGEPVFRVDIERGWSILGEDCLIVHQLSSTETNYISRYFIDRKTQLDTAVVPVGYSARDKEILILDPDGEPVGAGEVGQIVVRSRFLARGYWKDPELTFAKFAAQEDGSGTVQYRTGDRGRIDEEGRLHHIGRGDQQVRIRGYRVEIAEVEAALQALPGVRLSAAAALPGQTALERLAAYIVPEDPGRPLHLDQLREQLKGSLPEYMLPTDLILMDQMPVLASGKVDRSALLPPPEGRPDLSTSYIGPRDIYEERLVGIWERILGRRPVGVRDTFFQLGGNSLSAMRLVATITDELGESLPAASLLQAPTVEQQALLLRIEQSERPSARVIGIQTRGDRRPFFCVSPRTVEVVAYRELALKLGSDQPFYALYGVDMPERALDQSRIEHEAAAYVEDVRRITPHGPYRIGGYSNGGLIALEMARLMQSIGEEVELVVLLDVYGPEYRRMLPLLPRWSYRPLQNARRFQKSIEEFLPWLLHHLRVLGTFSWQDRVRYIRQKGGRHMDWWLLRARRWLTRRRDHPQPPSNRAAPIGRSYQNFRPEPYGGRVLIVRAERQPLGIQPDPVMGWGTILEGEMTIREVPGYHDSILFSPRLDVLADLLREALADPIHP